MPKLTKRLIDGLKAMDKELWEWDTEVKGFGVRVLPSSGTKSYVLQYRTKAGRERRLTLGRHGVLTVEEARGMARKHLVAVSDGADPAGNRAALRASPTVNDLLDRHIETHVKAHNSERTLLSTRDLFDRFARRALGALKVESVTRQDVAKHIPR